MNRDAPSFLSDPRPEDWQEPDDPRPEDWQEPDDPRPEDWQEPDDPRPEDWQEPDDPRPEDWQEPDDPRPEDWQEPDDPRPEDWQEPDDPRPEDWQEPDDPAVRRALQLLQRRRRRPRRARRGRRRRPARAARTRFRFDYSGRVVIRLSEDLDLGRVDGESDLWEVAEELGLEGLKRVLGQYLVESQSTGRSVDIEDHRRIDDEDLCPSEGEEAWTSDHGYPRLFGGEQKSDLRSMGRLIRWCYFWFQKLWSSEPPGGCTLRDLEERAALSELPPLHSLASYWYVDLTDQPKRSSPGPGEIWLDDWEPAHERTVRKLLRQLNQLTEVDLAYRELAATDPSPDTTPGDTYALVQEYLDRAPMGIDARWVWDQADLGDAGEEWKVSFADVEQGWIEHDDIKSGAAIVFGDNRHNKGEYRGHHGTAVLGEVLGRHGHDGIGIQGIAWGATKWVLLSSHYDDKQQVSGNVANAIRQLIPLMDAGDVLLLEVQRSYMPTEVDPLDRDAIRLAVAHGIIVIEAAGNGNADLDRYVDEEGRRVLNRRHPEFRESGALMVAAARAALPHNRLSGRVGVGSNHGSRIDCYAHGDRVVTTGYGDMNAYLVDQEDADDPSVLGGDAASRAYSAYFGGTSGAAPIIAGAALLAQKMHKSRAGVVLSPWEMRRLLSDPKTGTRQGGGVRGRIGVMPDLRRVLRERLALTSNLYLRDSVDDEGKVPLAGRIAACPDIVVRGEHGDNPGDFEDDPESLSELQEGQTYKVFVRLRNRGLQHAADPEIRVYQSPAATLVTPEMWCEIGCLPQSAGAARSAPPVSGTALSGSADAGAGKAASVWSGPLTWTAGKPHPALALPDVGQYCFTAIVRDGRDHEMVTPPDRWPYFDWRRYRAFLRWHNNVACRNLHQVASGANLPFLVTGTPDRARSFDLEIIRTLPSGLTVELVTHPALASALRRGRLWKGKEEEIDGRPRVRLTLPRQPRLLIGRVRLLAGAEFPCRLQINGAVGEGHSMAVRQLYRGQEVGRITWKFR